MATTASMHKNRTTTLGKIQGFVSTNNIFAPINFPTRLYPENAPVSISMWSLPGGSGAWKEWTFAQIIQQNFEPSGIGAIFGPTWTTHWLKLDITVPQTWTGKEVHLRWAAGCEGTVWSNEGKVLQGLSPGYREEFIISKSWSGTGPLTYYIEVAANHMFGAGEGSDIIPPKPDRTFALARCEIAVYDRDIFKLLVDFDMINGLAVAGSNTHIGYQALYASNEMINLIKAGDMGSASQLADRFFADGTGKKAHTLYAMGHCHIDTAWLWPYDETIRKCARSFSAQISLMQEYPSFIFACSQAQQYDWVRIYYPDLYRDMKQLWVPQGNFYPVGGTWSEMDGLMPSGESFIRQFFYGQRFFMREFGIKSRIFWLPDTFGYSANIPQLMKHVGMDRFLTQKMSWSIVNKFPNHNFWWEGIDGTKVLVHFPPGDSYNMQGSVQELLYSETNSQDKGRSNLGIYLYGNGDGGGGPTRTMIERLSRVQDTDGLPKVVLGNPDSFFDELEKEGPKLSKWSGELYLELHNGTYTSQARIKWFNRKGEFLLKEVELLMAMGYASGIVTETQIRQDMVSVDTDWQNLLLNQFHDVLPGSCIEMVAVDAWKIYEDMFADLMRLRAYYQMRLLGNGTSQFILYNALDWDINMVVFFKRDAGGGPTGPNIQSVVLQQEPFEREGEGWWRIPSQFSAALVNLRASGFSTFQAVAPTNPVTFTGGALSNGLIEIHQLEDNGVPYEDIFITTANGRESIFGDRFETGVKPGMFYIYDDIPLFWDAWDVMDYHLETQSLVDFTEKSAIAPFATGNIVGGYKWTGKFGEESIINRYVILRANSPFIEYFIEVDWKEKHRFLKLEFPVDILARNATYEMQYGFVERETHINTSWEMAKFEVCGHKWIDVSQADKGVTIFSDSKYGWCVRENVIKLSLLRAPKNPDANCDIHKHYFHYALYPHEGSLQSADVIRRAYEFSFLSANNVPLVQSDFSGGQLMANFVRTSNTAVIAEVSKVAHDAQKAVVVRCYESKGGNATTTITLGFNATKVEVCDGLEEPSEVIPTVGNAFEAKFHPFQIRSFLISF